MSAPKLQSVVSLRVIDLGVGMVAALAADHFSKLGATVLRVEPPAGDPFYDIYPAYATWRAGSVKLPRGSLDRELQRADVCIVGGEDFPGLQWSFDADAIAASSPRLVVLNLGGYIHGDASRRPAVDLLVQASSGLCRTQYPNRPFSFAFPAPTYGAALHGLVAAWAALLERERSGHGQVASSSLQQGAAMWCVFDWLSVDRPDHRSRAKIPLGVRQLTFRCADGEYIAFAMASDGALAKVYRALGIDKVVDPNDRGMPSPRADPKFFYADTDLLAQHAACHRRADLLGALWKLGVAAEAILPPGGVWQDPQVEHNGTIVRNAQGCHHVGDVIDLRVIGAANDSRPARVRVAADDLPPLAGVRVVDLGAFAAGPYASKNLADLGADVIKVEPPRGDPTRYNYAAWSSVNQGKRNLCVDAKTPDGAEILRRLCATADIVHHNFRPGVAQRLGIDPGSLRKLRPDVVTLETSAYGLSGPKASNSGFDHVLQAVCGHAVRAAGQGNPPDLYRFTIVDYGTGALGTLALLIGLFERQRCGGSVEAQTSLLNGGLFLMSELIRSPQGAFTGAPLMNNAQTGPHPAERFYQTADGWIAVAARTNEMAQAMARLLGLSPGPRNAWGAEESAQIAAQVRTRNTQELLAALAEAKVWAEVCVEDGWREVREDSLARRAGLVQAMQESHYGEVTCVGTLFTLARSGAGSANPMPAPTLGQHTRQILAELKFSAADIDDLYRRGIVA